MGGLQSLLAWAKITKAKSIKGMTRVVEQAQGPVPPKKQKEKIGYKEKLKAMYMTSLINSTGH
jgi:hypothetical protein